MAMIIGESKQKGGSDIPRIEDGLYPALLVGVVDIGLQKKEDYKTKAPKPPAREVLLTFELPTEVVEIDGEEKPRWISRNYTYSFHEKAALTGVVNVLKKSKKNPRTLVDLIGASCMVNVGSTSNNNAKISGIVPLVKGIDPGKLKNDPIKFDYDEPTEDDWNSLPQWVQNRIKDSLNYNDSPIAKMLANPSTSKDSVEAEYDNTDEFDDEIPY